MKIKSISVVKLVTDLAFRSQPLKDVNKQYFMGSKQGFHN